MQAVNLLPRDLVASERSRLSMPLLGASVVPLIALGLVIHGYGAAHGQAGTAISELSVLNAQVAEIAPANVRRVAEQQASTAATNALVAQRESRLASLEGALATEPTPLDTFLNQIARVLPAKVWLTTMNATPATSDVAGTFSLSGYSYSQSAVAEALAHLALLPSLTDVVLSSSSQSLVGTTTLVQFTITATPAAPPNPVTPGAPATTTPAGTTPAGTTTAP